MSLAPKNWQEFQHYKDRKPLWIKLHRDLLDNYEFSCLPVASRALAPMLWLLASEYEDGKITASPQEIAFRLRMSPGELHAAIKPLINAGFFIDASNTLADSYHDASLERETEKQDKTEKDIRTVANATRPSPADFQKFKAAYPKRGASNPWQPALKLFQQAVKSGIDPGQIIAGAARYADECDGLKLTGTDKVAQAQTWLRQARYLDYAPERYDRVTLTLDPYSDEWNAERAKREADGKSNSLMDAQAEKGRGWSIPIVFKEAAE